MLIAYSNKHFSSAKEFRKNWRHMYDYIIGMALNAEEFYDDQDVHTALQALDAVKRKLKETQIAAAKLARTNNNDTSTFLYLEYQATMLNKQIQRFIHTLSQEQYSDKGIRQRFRNLLVNIHNKLDSTVEHALDLHSYRTHKDATCYDCSCYNIYDYNDDIFWQGC